MGWLSNWILSRSWRKRRAAGRPRTYRPILAELEARVVPAGLGSISSNFINHGGPVLAHVQVEAVFLGDAWQNDASLQPTMQQIDSFLQYVVDSPFMDTMGQYGVGRGQLAGSAVLADSLGNSVSTSQIDSLLGRAGGNGTLPPAGADRLYVVFTPPNVRLSDNGALLSNVLGYHTSLFNGGGQDAYAVVPYPGGPNPQAPGLDTFQSLTETTSHELAEAVTDPYVNAQGNPSGWDDYGFTPGDVGEGEIADIADGLGAPPAYLTDNGTTYAVSELWSNQAGAAVAPGTSTSTTPPTTTPTTTPSPTMTSTLTVTGDNVTAQAGQPFQVTVATVSNPGDAGPLVARIDWGDGSWPSLVRLQGPDAQGNFTVAGWHDYHGAGSYTINVTVLDLRSGAEGSATATADVSAANSVSVTGQRIEATAGQSFTGTVARVSDPNASASNLTATIDWGDGSAANPDVTAGTVTTDGNGHLIVQGTHTYAKVGNYPVTVTVTDGTTGAQGKALSVADVDPAPSLPVAGVNVAAAPGQSFTDVIGVVEAHGASASDLSVTVNWGDGTTDSTANGTVQVVPFGTGGRFVIVGTHTYASAGQDTISFTVTDSANGLTGSGSSTATVTAAPATTTATPTDPTPTDPTPTVPPVVTLPVTVTGHRHHHTPAVSHHHASRRRG